MDGLKVINDTQGHTKGDELLQHTANVLCSVFRDGDVVARIGGDEFAVLLENQPEPVEVARTLLGSLRAPFKVDDRVVSVLASIGLARIDPLDPTPTIDALLMRADLAMYVVKRRG